MKHPHQDERCRGLASSQLTFVEESLHVDEDIGESGELLFVLQQLGQVVGDGLCVVVVDVAHPHSTQGTKFSRAEASPSFVSVTCDADWCSLGSRSHSVLIRHTTTGLSPVSSQPSSALSSCLARPGRVPARLARPGVTNKCRDGSWLLRLSCTYQGWPTNTG